MFSRGFEPTREKVNKGSRYIRSCFNCEHYYEAVGDKEEVCQNPDVLQYDMIVSDTVIYCTQWSPLSITKSSPFKVHQKTGRSAI